MMTAKAEAFDQPLLVVLFFDQKVFLYLLSYKLEYLGHADIYILLQV